MPKLTNVLILAALLAGSVSAQTPSQTPSRFRLDLSDAGYWAGVGIGTGLTASNPKHEFQFVLVPAPGQPPQLVDNAAMRSHPRC